jgi:hypothetical protein
MTENTFKRRWHQYSLRTLLLLVAAVSVVLACLTSYLRPRLEFRKAAGPIREMGGHVEGDSSLGAAGITSVVLSHTPLTDADLGRVKEHLETLPNLKELWLGYTQITDAGLVHLRRLTEVEWLWLDGTHITDAEREHHERLLGARLCRRLQTEVHLRDVSPDDFGAQQPGSSAADDARLAHQGKVNLAME